jgi:hypothetical protein
VVRSDRLAACFVLVAPDELHRDGVIADGRRVAGDEAAGGSSTGDRKAKGAGTAEEEREVQASHPAPCCWTTARDCADRQVP